MKRIIRPLRGAFCILAGILSAMSFTLGQSGYAGIGDLPASATSYLWTALALCFAWLYHHVFVKRQTELRTLPALFALFFGVCNSFGSVLFAFDTWNMSLMRLALTLLKAVGQAMPMAAALCWIDRILRWGALRRQSALDRVRMPSFTDKHETLCVMLLLILCWSPYLIAFFPGTVCWDLGEMVAQFFGKIEMDTWHPVFTTWVMGACVWLGRLIGSDNMGAFLFTMLQTLALSFALARSVGLMKKLGLNRLVRLCAVLFFALVPIWGGYAQFISKDTLYTSVLLLFTLSVIRLVSGTASCTLREAAELFVWGLLSCLLRSNGLYVVAPTAVVLIVLGLRGKARFTACAALCAAVAGAVAFSNVLIPALGIRDETASGVYSVCFQQSARVLRDHADTVTPEEYAAIDRVLDAEKLPDLYEPWISDPVKYTFRQYGQGAELEKAALAEYRGTWLSMMKKYPLTYAESFFAGNLSYYTFQPKMNSERSYNGQAGNRLVFETYELGDSRGWDPAYLDTTQLGFLAPIRTLLAMFARGWRHIPVLGMIYVCAVYTWTLVGAAISLVHQKRFRVLIAFLPALLSLGVCMLSPVNDYFRYFLPIVAMTVPLLASAAE